MADNKPLINKILADHNSNENKLHDDRKEFNGQFIPCPECQKTLEFKELTKRPTVNLTKEEWFKMNKMSKSTQVNPSGNTVVLVKPIEPVKMVVDADLPEKMKEVSKMSGVPLSRTEITFHEFSGPDQTAQMRKLFPGVFNK